MKTYLNNDGVVTIDKRLQPLTVSAANTNPPKRIARIKELINTKEPRICVLRGEGIGDVLMTTPTVHALVKLFNNKIELTYATNTAYLNKALSKVLMYNPDINKVIDRDHLNEADYDVVVNLHCPAIMHEKPMAPPINRIDLFARHAGVSLVDTKPHFYLQPEEINNARSALYGITSTNKKKILVNLVSSAYSRSMLNSTIYSALAELGQLGYQLLIVSHDSDHSSTNEAKSIPGCIPIHNKDVRELAAIMTQCNLVLCPDSAILHIAGALSIPTVALFGPTDPRARVNYYPNAKAIWGGEGMPGHPHWYEKCPFGDLCWKSITKEQIVNACLSQLKYDQASNFVACDLI